MLSHNSANHTFQPGDYNQDGIVDSADYTIWRDSLGLSDNLAADGDGDGIIGEGDYDVWVGHFGLSSGRGSGSAISPGVAVPEPSTLVLTGVALLLIAALPTARRLRL